VIVYRFWTSRDKWDPQSVVRRETRHWDGWFLLGFIPLYIRLRERS
jgi:hypothetical protein